MVGTRRNLTGEVHVVVADRRTVDRLAQIGAVDEHIELGTRLARLGIVDDPGVTACRQIDTEAAHRGIDVRLMGPEQCDVVVAREHLGDAAVDLLTAAQRRPVQVVDTDAQAPVGIVGGRHACGHLTTSHFITSMRPTVRPGAHRSRSMAGSRRM